MSVSPVDEQLPADFPSGECEDQRLLFVDRGVDLGTIQHEKRFHFRVANTLVPIDEGVALDK